ncbi:hypothetical protein B0T11DRAFT_101100 [Plectosphaerella cucumerina]|uniref:Uncharacterized protein n=1 Tax=Plectosphaerella cucumerina TaxID=40658 RepID=A0A8K0X115_9PEZI|nr:hypothetical protein B0T11DRAFT_101100 [Plectosphaerella cucumerina]
MGWSRGNWRGKLGDSGLTKRWALGLSQASGGDEWHGGMTLVRWLVPGVECPIGQQLPGHFSSGGDDWPLNLKCSLPLSRFPSMRCPTPRDASLALGAHHAALHAPSTWRPCRLPAMYTRPPPSLEPSPPGPPCRPFPSASAPVLQTSKHLPPPEKASRSSHLFFSAQRPPSPTFFVSSCKAPPPATPSLSRQSSEAKASPVSSVAGLPAALSRVLLDIYQSSFFSPATPHSFHSFMPSSLPTPPRNPDQDPHDQALLVDPCLESVSRAVRLPLKSSSSFPPPFFIHRRSPTSATKTPVLRVQIPFSVPCPTSPLPSSSRSPSLTLEHFGLPLSCTCLLAPARELRSFTVGSGRRHQSTLKRYSISPSTPIPLAQSALCAVVGKTERPGVVHYQPVRSGPSTPHPCDPRRLQGFDTHLRAPPDPPGDWGK